jgi:gluconolactonase
MATRELAAGLQFPEGPIAMDDGSVILVEIMRGTLSRVTAGGEIEVLADLGGGPNGAAMGPDGAIYVCNNGGFDWIDVGGAPFPVGRATDYTSGRIERVDLATGETSVLYTECDGNPLNGPNDIVFDASGGFWFTDLGQRHGRQQDRGAVFYARPDGSMIREAVYPADSPNGIGLSADESTLYVADTNAARLWAFDLSGPGEIAPQSGHYAGRCLAGMGGLQHFDSLAVDAEGTICVATILNGGITCISPDGARVTHTPTGDLATTNICFGGEDLKTAYITLSGSGRLVAMDWPTAGLPLNFLNR